MTASFGVAQLGHDTDIVKRAENADSMLYKAKLDGRNTVMPGLIKVHRTCLIIDESAAIP